MSRYPCDGASVSPFSSSFMSELNNVLEKRVKFKHTQNIPQHECDTGSPETTSKPMLSSEKCQKAEFNSHASITSGDQRTLQPRKATLVKPPIPPKKPPLPPKPRIAPKPSLLNHSRLEHNVTNEMDKARFPILTPFAPEVPHYKRHSTPTFEHIQNSIVEHDPDSSETTIETSCTDDDEQNNTLVPSTTNTDTEQERLKNLKKAADEIYTNEENFMQQLDQLTDEFKNFLEKSHEWERSKNDAETKISDRSAEVMHKIWKELIRIREAHRDIFGDLKYAINRWDPLKPDIVSAIRKHSKQLSDCLEFLQQRGEFEKNFEEALKNDSVFKRRTAEFEKSHLKGLSYSSQLDLIHQNLARYKLLLERYGKYLIPNELEEANVKSAILVIDQIVYEMNQKLEEQIMWNRQLELSSRFDKRFNVFGIDRKLQHEGDVYATRNDKREPRYLILFSDVLVVARASQDSKKPIHHYKCLPCASIHADGEEHIERERYFILQFNKDDQMILTTYYVESKEIRNKWITKINDVAAKAVHLSGFSSGQIDDVSLSSSISYDPASLPSYIPDSKCTKCMMEGCATKFGSKTKKPHCRQCGWIMCDRCTGYTPLPTTCEVDKVCPECYERNLEKFMKGELLPEYMVDRRRQKVRSSLYGVRIIMDNKSRDWKELFIPPQQGIRPKERIEDDMASGTIYLKGKVGVERIWWARLNRRSGSVILSLYNAELDTKAHREFDITNCTFSSDKADNGERIFELNLRKDVINFRIRHSGNADRWNAALEEALSTTTVNNTLSASRALLKMSTGYPVLSTAENSSDRLI